MHYTSPHPECIYYIGDVVICPAVAKREAKKALISFNRRLEELTIHGILHLHGYKDETEQDWKKMKKVQEKFLEQIVNL